MPRGCKIILTIQILKLQQACCVPVPCNGESTGRIGRCYASCGEGYFIADTDQSACNVIAPYLKLIFKDFCCVPPIDPPSTGSNSAEFPVVCSDWINRVCIVALFSSICCLAGPQAPDEIPRLFKLECATGVLVSVVCIHSCYYGGTAINANQETYMVAGYSGDYCG